MLASRLFIHTTKQAPTEVELISHQLMLRAGYIRQHASGIYSWLPLGWRAAHKVEQIVREEMDRAGAAEVRMPSVCPKDLWEQSGRWNSYGKELLRLQDRHEREFCLGPTHEEIVTDIVRASIKSYKQLPVNLYQIQTKFRDEIRPRFGVLRAREFVMKDAYSFDVNKEMMQQSYECMHTAYCRIFDRLNLSYRVIDADSGTIGGSHSQEFMVLADSGESEILFDDKDFAANSEQAACLPPQTIPEPGTLLPLEKIHTPNIRTIAALSEFLADRAKDAVSIKTMIVKGDNGACALLLKGDHSLNLVKAAKLEEIGDNPFLLKPEQAKELIGADFGSLGPINMPLPIIADHALQGATNLICGANENDYHYLGAQFNRDFPLPQFADLRFALAGDQSPANPELTLQSCRGIEVGHIFQLGNKYSKSMDALIDDSNQQTAIEMGCYGIGITRIVAAAIEQNHDERGICLPAQIAPFCVGIIGINREQDQPVASLSQELYDKFQAAQVDCMLEDRALRPGVLFAEHDLLGIAHRIVVSPKHLDAGKVEYKARNQKEPQLIDQDQIVQFLLQQLEKNHHNL